MNLAAVLVTGLFAGGVSCAVVQGGLLTGLITRQRGATTQADTSSSTRATQTAHRPTWRGQLGDDLAPVGGFLAGKLVSHTLLGVVVITAATGYYSPDNIEVRAGVPTTLVIRSANAQGCVRAFVIPSRNEQRILPTTGDTLIDLGVLQPGRLDYSCGMGMYTGTITIV